MKPEQIAIFLSILLIAAFLAIIIPVCVIHARDKKFVLQHSKALKQLDVINNSYHFNNIVLYDMSHSYDNENFYENISPEDYLIYQLVYMQGKISKQINNARGNRIMFEKYKEEVAEKCKLGFFDVDELPGKKENLLKIEKSIFESKKKSPITGYSVGVHLELRNMNDVYQDSKGARFSMSEICYLIDRVNDKNGDFYNDREIWDAICRVERGKVTNRMRFAIYDRDGRRCRKCGRRTDDLEIDHIVPIAKGGKSTMDNLQTLCPRCNKEKGNKTEYYDNKYRRW